MAEVILLVAALWDALSCFVTELTVVPTGVMGLQRVFDGAAAASL